MDSSFRSCIRESEALRSTRFRDDIPDAPDWTRNTKYSLRELTSVAYIVTVPRPESRESPRGNAPMNVQVQNRRQEVLDTCLSRRLLSVRFPAILETTGVDEKAGRGELRITKISNEGHAMRFGYLPVETKAEAITDFSKGFQPCYDLGMMAGDTTVAFFGSKVGSESEWEGLKPTSQLIIPITTHYTQDNQGLTCDTGISAHMSSVGIRNNGKGSFDPFPLNLFELKCRSLQ
ncbi:predicted protein [Histoplasma capsulatum G186AR]|uniref:Uncharacterized protein n=1 Tax=Ajellomyces capsulatus (strain G186AR / H82 / ATCC MYA-2454 / RMSCC 2432) TaxID=447093 RepID=C0NF11_AJECG|nr:uncharacterized protein HCBG_01477 [Histoplasma capsulatum G186AR]EEH09832.1 predicted protein [Histoplasma capsulatum G186AR]